MAVDTANKRFSIGHMLCPWRSALPVPDGTIDASDKLEFMLLYSGISASAGITFVYGPLWVAACEVFSPGPTAIEPFIPGCQSLEVFTPGPSAIEVTPR